MMAARARALTDPSADAQRKLVLDAKEQQQHGTAGTASWVASLYAGVIAHMQARQLQEAQTLLDSLQQVLRNQTAEMDQLRWLECELRLKQGKALQALGALNGVSFSSARGRAQRMLKAQALLETQQPDMARQAVEWLESWLGQHPRDGQAWDLTGQALGLAQDPLRSLRAQAEARAVHFDYVAAIDRLTAAQELVRNLGRDGGLTRAQEIEASIIDTRLRQLKLARREQTLQR
jgi:predicted Zn-dependent protease